MTASPEGRGDPTLRHRLAGSALRGAAGLLLIGVPDLCVRLGAGPALSRPVRDFSELALVGAMAGIVVACLPKIPRVGRLSPFGTVLGAGAGGALWLNSVSGSTLLGEVAPVALAGRAVLSALTGLILGQGLGVLIGRALPTRRPRLSDALIAFLLVLPALIPIRPQGVIPGDRPSVLLLTIDTLRADRLGYAGHPSPTSPHLDRLARGGVRFARAVTPLPRTLPAIASLMTAAYPHDHGVRDNFHYTLGDARPTLASRFREAGWATAAVNSNPVLSHDSGIYRGFTVADARGDDWSRLSPQRGLLRLLTLAAMRHRERAEVITDRAIAWLRARPADQPFFLWVHWLAPHMPYDPPRVYARRFDPGYEGEYRDAFDYHRIGKGEMTYRNPLSARTRAHARRLYDAEVATADRALGRLLKTMEESGWLQNTRIIATSDHGESLNEHGYHFNHGDFVYGPATDIPLILAGFDYPPGDVPPAAATGLTDLFPLVEEAVDLPRENSGAVPLADASRIRFGESGFCRFPHLNDRIDSNIPKEIAQDPDLAGNWREDWEASANRAKQRFVIRDGWKLVRTPGAEKPRMELFDLRLDPGELHDLSGERPRELADLVEILNAWVRLGDSRVTDAGTRTIDDELRQRMESLGYVGD